MTVLEAIAELNARAGAQGVGRLDMVEDRLVGIKSREVYEAPGAIALITAHQELENVTVERDLARFKRSVEQRWGELVYDGLWFSPLKRALDAFIAEANAHVTGDIRLTLHGGTRRRDRPAQRRSRSTTTTWRPTTPATPSTSRWPRASSSCGACRARSRRKRDHRQARPDDRRLTGARPACGAAGSPAARPRRWPRCRVACTSTGGSRRTTSPARGPTPACCTAPACSTTTSWRGMLAALDDARRRRRGRARSGRPSTTRTCTPRSSAGCSSGSARSAASCAPAAAATTRSPPTSGSTCATHARQIAGRVAELRDGAARPGRAAPSTRRARASRTCSTRSRCCSRHQLARARARARPRRRPAARLGRAGRAVARSAPARSPAPRCRSTREAVAAELGFTGADRQLDRRRVATATSSPSSCFVAALIGVHLSRLGEEVCLWATARVRLGRRSTTPTRPGRRSCRRRRTPTSPSWPAARPVG